MQELDCVWDLQGVCEIKMRINTLGEFLKYYRHKYEFGQEKICSGICSLATLSRVEKGDRIIDSLMAESLLGRIGKQVLEFELLLNDLDYKLWCLRQEIENEMRREHFEKVKELLSIYKEQMLEESVHQQFIFYYEAKIKIVENAPVDEICELLYYTLKLTKTEIDSNNEENILWNPLEIELVLLLVHYRYQEWKNKDNENMLLKLLTFVEKVYSGSQKEDTGVRILMELVELEWQLKDDRRVIKYADDAVDFIATGRGIDFLADFHFYKAKAIEHLYHHTDKWCEEEKKCKEECLMAYYVFDILKQVTEQQKLQKFCEDKLTWQIIG